MIQIHKNHHEAGGYSKETQQELSFDIVCKNIPSNPYRLLSFENWIRSLESIFGVLEQLHVLTKENNRSSYYHTVTGFIRFLNYVIHPLVARLFDHVTFYESVLEFEISFKPMSLMHFHLDFRSFRADFETKSRDDVNSTSSARYAFLSRAYELPSSDDVTTLELLIFDKNLGKFSPSNSLSRSSSVTSLTSLFNSSAVTVIECFHTPSGSFEDLQSIESCDKTIVGDPSPSEQLSTVISGLYCICRRLYKTIPSSEIRVLSSCGHVLCSSCIDSPPPEFPSHVTSSKIECPFCSKLTSATSLIPVCWSL